MSTSVVNLFNRVGSQGLSAPASDAITRSVSEMERSALVQAVKDWGYYTGAIKSRRDLWKGRRILDVGMGGGPHSVSFIEGGASSYVGVDPLVGTGHVRDFRNLKDPAIPAYHAFPFPAAEIMRIYPNIHLYTGLLEDVSDQVRAHKVDIAMMAAVTEHLERPHDVIRSIWTCLDRGGHLWISHCNYYSWTGHHRNPRSVAGWNRADPEQSKHVDWKHLEPDHPDYSNRNFNRVRMADLRDVIDKYFEIVEWKVCVEGLSRLTPELRYKWRKYTLEELLGQNIYITGRRRDVPLGLDLTGRELHHPSASYLADVDHSAEPLGHYALANSVYFSGQNTLHSHSDNESAALRVFEHLKAGDRITLAKFTNRRTVTVAEVARPQGSTPRLLLAETTPPEIVDGNHDQWSIVDLGPIERLYDRGGPTATVAAVTVDAMPARRPSASTGPRPGDPLAAAIANAAARYGTDPAAVAVINGLVGAIGEDAYAQLQARYAETITKAARPDGDHKYLDIPFWVGHKFSLAQKLGLVGHARQTVLDLGTGGGHLLYVLGALGHTAVGVDGANQIHGDIATRLQVDRRTAPIKRETALPDFGQKFDLVTSVWVNYDQAPGSPLPVYWGPRDWAYLLNDLVDRHLAFPARIHLQLNEHQMAPGVYAQDGPILDWFMSQGAMVDRKAGIVDLTLTTPRRFVA
jgi:2-polyprenyl-3-methyl-5-hydroxy-6-metoxy-1,4-benzoquinol methylase